MCGLWLVGCGGPGRNGVHESDASSSYAVVGNEEPREWATPRVIEPDLWLGSIDGNAPDGFGRVYSFEVDSVGRIAILDGMDGLIKVFDPSGRHLRSFAGKGNGPGEIALSGGMITDLDDRLWVLDLGKNEYLVYDFEGNLLETHRRGPTSMVFPWRAVVDDQGNLVDLTLQRLLGDGRTPLSRVRGRVTKHTVGFTRYTPILRDRRGAIRELPPVDHYYPLLRYGTPAPSSSHFTLTIDPRGVIWHTTGIEYRVVKRSFDGDTLLVFTKRHQAVDLTSEERDSLIRGYQRSGVRPPIPPSRKAVARIVIDHLGRIVVQPNAATDQTPSSFDVFSRDGVYLGSVDAPFPVHPGVPAIFTEDAVYMLTLDSLDVPYVVRGRIRLRP